MPKSVDKKPVKKSGARAAAIAGRVLAGQAVSWAEIETLAASVLAQAEKPAPAKASAKKVRASHV